MKVEKLNIENIEKLLHFEPSEKIFIRAIKGLRAKKEDIHQRWIIRIICLILGLIVGFNHDTVRIYQDSVEFSTDMLLAFFGIIFTGYSLLQAFMNKKMLIQLLIDEKKEDNGETKSRLQDINENFTYLMTNILAYIIGSLVIRTIITCMPDDFCVFSNATINSFCAAILIIIYYDFTGIILCRIVSFLTSIYHLFNIYAVTRLTEILDEEEKMKNEK
uniref:Uncharacterized protein n=1 Tax=Myoviridae sp. ctP4M4 TaxID=2826647 RepID=A0A8S5N287_9CAUD|nr:MAG TPA: hypothetical protein [Myoviridae sp. ctP4M4]